MTSYPDIWGIARLHLGPEDVLVLKNAEIEVDQELAHQIRSNLRRETGKPDLPVLILGRDWDLSVVEAVQ